MNEFGTEFVNVAERLVTEADRMPVEVIAELARGAEARFLYFGGRTFAVTALDTLPLVTFPDGVARRTLIFPDNKTLWFAPGAQLVLDPGVAIIIRGSIRASPLAIFDLPEVRILAMTPGAALVRIESEDIEEVFAEWFGLVSIPNAEASNRAIGQQNQRALQACVHAACRDRSLSTFSTIGPLDPPPRLEIVRRLPPLTVVLRGIYDFIGTVEASALPGETPSLWMRGENNFVRGSNGIPALRRLPAAVANPTALPEEPANSAAVRVAAPVSVRWERVGVHVEFFTRGRDLTTPPGPLQVGSAVRVEEDATSPPWRHALFDRCGMEGGRYAVLALVDGRVLGGQKGGAPKGPAPAQTRATRYTLNDCSLSALYGEVRSSRTALDIALSQDAMVELNGGLYYRSGPHYGWSGGGPYFGPPPPGENGAAYHVDLQAAVSLRASSLLVRGASFHTNEGPRPTRWAPEQGQAALPDGQDLWLDMGDGSSGLHVTALHVDSQSWSFLGMSRAAADAARGAVTLLNVGATNVNWSDYREVRSGATTPSFDAGNDQSTVLTDPPSVAWRGGSMPLLLEGCCFERYVTTAVGSGGVVSIGTMMYSRAVPNETTWWLGEAVWRYNASASPSAAPLRRRLSVATGLMPPPPQAIDRALGGSPAMTFGRRFINVLDDLAATYGFAGPSPDVSAALNDLARTHRGPYTLYLSRTVRLTTSVDLPENLTVMFGPGATAALGHEVHWVIRGPTDLGLGVRFVTDYAGFGSGAPFVGPRITLAGPLDAIRPEWFRGLVRLAGEDDGLRGGDVATEPSDDRALAAAIACAAYRIEHGLPQVPIKLRGPYLLRQPMRLTGRSDGGECEYVFEGRHPRGDAQLAPTFSRHPQSLTAHALWSVGAKVRVRASNVAFDARAGDAPEGGDRAAVSHLGYVDGSSYERCTFFVDRGVGVWCSARHNEERGVAGRGVPESISFTGCWFHCESVGDPPTALLLDENGPARLRVDGCAFRGDARAMIAAAAGMVDVTACDFHTATASGLPGRIGADLVVGLLARPAPSSTPLGPLLLNLIHVQTRSPRHLDGSRDDAPGGSVVSLTGLVARRGPVAGTPPPVIRWRGTVGDQFLLQGSDVSGQIDVPGLSDQGGPSVKIAVHERSG